MILTSLNQITRLGFIIKVFIFNALIFILLDQYFLGLTYIIVYVGNDNCLTQLNILPLINYNKIGPHNIDIQSKIYGSLLGNSNASKRNNRSTHIIFQQENSNKEYLKWFHKNLVNLGYCKINKPILKKRIGLKGKIKYIYNICTFNYTSFNYIYNSFYNDKDIKIIPLNISDFLTPLAQAIWISENGSKERIGLKLSIYSFTKEEIKFLSQIILEKYNIKTSINYNNKGQCYLYILKKSMPNLINLVKPIIHKSMYYKLDQTN